MEATVLVEAAEQHPSQQPDLDPDLVLDRLAAVIREADRACGDTLRTSVEHAIAAGRALIEAKAHPDLKHGDWLRWLADNTGIKPGRAQRYMRIAEEQPLLANASSATYLTQDAALRLISDERKRRRRALRPPTCPHGNPQANCDLCCPHGRVPEHCVHCRQFLPHVGVGKIGRKQRDSRRPMPPDQMDFFEAPPPPDVEPDDVDADAEYHDEIEHHAEPLEHHDDVARDRVQTGPSVQIVCTVYRKPGSERFTVEYTRHIERVGPATDEETVLTIADDLAEGLFQPGTSPDAAFRTLQLALR